MTPDRHIARMGFVIGICLPGLLGSCGAGGGSAPQEAALLQRVYQAQREYDFSGVRVRVQRDSPGDAAKTSEIHERVFHRSAREDGEERHLVELLGVSEGPQNPEEWNDEKLEELQLTIRVRSNFIERFREFRLRDVELALKNYDVRIEGTEEVAGRACRKMRLIPIDRNRSHSFGQGEYELWIDEETAIPLRTREYLRSAGKSGALVAESEYLEFGALDPDAEVPWVVKNVERTSLAEDELPLFLEGRAVGFPPPIEGFETVRRETLGWGDVGRFVVHVASNGVEAILVLQGLPDEATRLVSGGGETASEQDAELAIGVVNFGSTRSLFTTFHGVSTYVIGKGSKRDLKNVFERLFSF